MLHDEIGLYRPSGEVMYGARQYGHRANPKMQCICAIHAAYMHAWLTYLIHANDPYNCLHAACIHPCCYPMIQRICILGSKQLSVYQCTYQAKISLAEYSGRMHPLLDSWIAGAEFTFYSSEKGRWIAC